VKIAGVLHDTVEDTDTTIDDIKEKFGENVALLVGGHTEDKSKTWVERKSEDVASIKKGTKELKAVIFADKLSNILSLYDDYRVLGDGVFEKFNAGKDLQAWYYGELLNAFSDSEDCLSVELVEQFRDTYNKIFNS